MGRLPLPRPALQSPQPLKLALPLPQALFMMSPSTSLPSRRASLGSGISGGVSALGRSREVEVWQLQAVFDQLCKQVRVPLAGVRGGRA